MAGGSDQAVSSHNHWLICNLQPSADREEERSDLDKFAVARDFCLRPRRVNGSTRCAKIRALRLHGVRIVLWQMAGVFAQKTHQPAMVGRNVEKGRHSFVPAASPKQTFPDDRPHVI